LSVTGAAGLAGKRVTADVVPPPRTTTLGAGVPLSVTVTLEPGCNVTVAEEMLSWNVTVQTCGAGGGGGGKPMSLVTPLVDIRVGR